MSASIASVCNELNIALASSTLPQALDSKDPLSEFRSEFAMPKSPNYENQEALYLCGNSLGLMPLRSAQYVKEELGKWALQGVEGHFGGSRAWATVDEESVRLLSGIVGALPHEVAVMNSLTVNLNLLMVTFYRPDEKRFKILVEDNLFCSDSHAVESQIRNRNLNVADTLVKVSPRKGELTIRLEDILAKIKRLGSELALILIGGVQFFTGQLFDMKSITEAGHAVGAVVGFDLAHAVGNVPLSLHDWNVDFACWCSYKYLNAGPGGIGGAFVHDRYANRKDLPRLEGWWGQDFKARFRMGASHSPLRGAQGFQMSNPPVLQTVALQGSLEIFERATMEQIHAKQILLTGYLEALLDKLLSQEISILTPRSVSERGSQLSLRFTNGGVRAIHNHITSLGVICDVREPDVMRVAPAPLYNSFQDVFRFVQLLHEYLRQPVPGA